MSGKLSSAGRELYEFGPFRVDPEKEVLLRDGSPVPLTPKTFQILLVLVRNAQEVVAKDDLMKSVWPDTFVEEANLSRNVFMLRKALGESPEDHRYILTVPGRGYRLAEKVRLLSKDDVSVVAATNSRVQVVVTESRSWKWFAVMMVSVLLLALATYWFLSQRKPVLTEKDAVVLGDFTNTTGDPVFDGTLRRGLSIQLEQSPLLSLVSDERIQQTLRLMEQPADAHLTPALAREICERTGSFAVLNGSIAMLGKTYILGLESTDCHSGEVLEREQVQASRKEDVLNALTEIASTFRKRMGESHATIAQHNRPLQEATTPSLEALKEYSMGWQVHDTKGAALGLPFFKRAVEIDPQFASAYAALALFYGHTGQSALSTQMIQKAYELRNRAGDNERFFIEAYYQGRGTGNQEKAQQICEEWKQAYPRQITPHAFLAGFIYPGLARYDKAVEEGQEAVRLNPDFSTAYYLLGSAEMLIGRLDEVQKAIQQANARKIDIPEFLFLRYDIAFLRNDEGEMKRVADVAEQNSGAQDWIAQRQAFVSAYEGRLRDAQQLSRHAADLAQESGGEERAALFATAPALWEGFFGNPNESKKLALAALAQPHGRETDYGVALALALSGDSSRSEALITDLEKRFPEDTSVRFSYVPTVRAVLALKRGQPSKAIEVLEISRPFDLSTPRCTLQGLFGALYTAYVRGLAYLASGDSTQAAGEFRKVIDHRGIVVSDPIGALAQLQLARAYAAAGEKAQARTAYQTVLELWKHADSDVSLFKQATVEYSALESR